MHRPIHLFALLALLASGCEQSDDPKTPASQKIRRDQTAGTISPATPTNPAPPGRSSLAEVTRDTGTLADHIHEISGDALPELMEAIAAKPDPAFRRSLLTTVYEESGLRPPSMRLPLLLEIARTKDVDPALQTTIMGELGATLQTDHGTSWADWSLAIEEYLADNHGLIRTE